MKNELKNKLKKETRYLHIAIPYDKDDSLITFDNGVMIELECDEEFTPPMLNAEDMLLEYLIDLKDQKVINWNYEEGYLRMRAKVRDSGTYTLLDTEKNPLLQIRGYVPNNLIPPFERGYGDYIELSIEYDGKIENWPSTPNFSDFIEEGKEPTPIKTNKWHRAEEAFGDVRRRKLNKEEMEWLIGKLVEVKTSY